MIELHRMTEIRKRQLAISPYIKKNILQLVVIVLIIGLLIKSSFLTGSYQNRIILPSSLINRMDSAYSLMQENNKLKERIRWRDSVDVLRVDSLKYAKKLLNEKISNNSNLSNTQLTSEIRKYLYGTK